MPHWCWCWQLVLLVVWQQAKLICGDQGVGMGWLALAAESTAKTNHLVPTYFTLFGLVVAQPIMPFARGWVDVVGFPTIGGRTHATTSNTGMHPRAGHLACPGIQADWGIFISYCSEDTRLV